MHRIALAHLTAIGLTPPEIIHLAAEIGCEGVALNPGLVTTIDLGGPVSRIDNDPVMRRATAQALADTGVTMDLVDAIVLLPDVSLPLVTTMMEVFAELGATRVNIAPLDTDASRFDENLMASCELAQRLGMTPMIEFFRLGGGPVPTLKDAVRLATSGRYPGLKILIDTLHLTRSGEGASDIAAIDPALIGAVQICDGALGWPGDEAYGYEAIFERAIPGEGEIALIDILRLIPGDRIVSPEVPLKSLRDAGVPIRECARRAVEGTRRVAAAAFA